MAKTQANLSLVPTILAGGSGTRLWPLSRASHPKQFLSLDGHLTMLQQTALRVDGLPVSRPVVVCSETHRFFVAEQLREIDRMGPIILEPHGRNTAPAIALSAFLQNPESLMLVLPADHVITSQSAFCDAVNKAIPLATRGKLVTFGVTPTEANPGYGYIQAGDPIEIGSFAISSFKEKPDLETASSYFESGDYYWNSGIFLFTAGHYLSELKTFEPEIYDSCRRAIESARSDLDFIRVDSCQFESCPSNSIDYAVMERTSEACVVPMDAQWSDVGSWSALWDLGAKDENGNAVRGDAILHDSYNNYIRADEKLVATVGIDNLVVVATKDAILVARKERAQEAGKIVKLLKTKARCEWELHREVFRPWGKYDSIDKGARYQVKRITVNSGAKLSVQMHHHRAEHWVVVSGSAKVTIGDETFLLAENQSTYIPIGVTHSLENPGKVPLEIVEIQSGSYLGEDDIVRFEDRYGRVDSN